MPRLVFAAPWWLWPFAVVLWLTIAFMAISVVAIAFMVYTVVMLAVEATRAVHRWYERRASG